jgi:hypothetical protein
MPVIVDNLVSDRLKSFTRLMSTASKLYHANPENSPKKMNISDDEVLSLLGSLNRHQVRFLVVGGMAGVVHGHIRTTQDMDIWLKSDGQTKAGLILALEENDVAGAAHLKDVPLLVGWTSVSVGGYGFTLDMGYALKAFSNEDFEACYERALNASFDGVPFKVIQLNDLIAEKLVAGRSKDMADVEELTKIRDRKQDGQTGVNR